VKRLLGIATTVGLLLTIGGAITLAVSQNSEAVFAADRAEIPEPLTFDTHDGRYRIMLLRDPVTPNFGTAEARLLCTVALADGSELSIDTATQATRAESDLGIELGSFDAVAGRTTVACDWKDGGGGRFYYYSVAPSPSVLGIVGVVALVVGLVLLVGGGLLAVRSRMRGLTARRPLSAEGQAAGPPPVV
jgi:hypothetical protein